jgi:hypothetical protein
VSSPVLNDTMAATFIDPTGVEWPLTYVGDDLGWFTTEDVTGWGARPFEYTLDPIPSGGDDVRFIRAQSARIIWPMHIWGADHLEFRQRYRQLRRAIMSTVHLQSPATLRLQLVDGSSREIRVYYEDGFGGERSEHVTFANPVITFLAPEGYWRGSTPVEVWREYDPVVQSFLSPFLSLSSGQVLGQSSIDNTGDVAAFPVWTVRGPMTSLTAINRTTNQSFTATYSLADNSETITINTDPPTIRGPAGQNITDALNWPDAYLWHLLPGINEVEFVAGGPGPGTRVTISYTPRYDGI